MPTYEYKCNKCNSVFEEFQSMTEEPLTQCRSDNCDGTVYRIISSGAGFLFKGSGFYETDYRSDSYKKKAADEKKDGKPSTEKKSTDSTSTKKETNTKE